MRRIIGLSLVVFLGAISLSAANVKLLWTPGWDTFNQPLDWAHSFVRFNQPSGTSNLEITYHIHGATPNKSYAAGLHIFHRCLTSFGQFTSPFLCNVNIQRQGKVVDVVQAYELGTIATNPAGNGDLVVKVTGIAPGDYVLEFHVRSGNTCTGFAGTCDVIYQSPGPFG